MSAALTTLLGAVGVVGAMLGVLLPVIRAQGASIRRELDTLRTDLRADVAEVRGDLRALTARVDAVAERVARIEGAINAVKLIEPSIALPESLLGPYRTPPEEAPP